MDFAQVWHNVKQLGFLPFASDERAITDVSRGGSALNGGAYGRILAGVECVSCRYPLTESVLKLIATLIPVEY